MQWVLLVTGYLAALAGAESLVAFGNPQIGMALHSILLVALLTHAALAWKHRIGRLFLALSFAPLIRLVSLSLPLAGIPLIHWYWITSAPLFVTVIFMAHKLQYGREELGLCLRGLPVQIGVAISGLMLGYAEYLIFHPQPLISTLEWEQFWLPALILLVSTGLVEELIFRGLMQRTAIEVLGRAGLVFVAVVFAAMHIGYRSGVDTVFALAVGLYFGWIVARTGSLWGVTFAHGLINIMLFLVLPLRPPP